jgi:hypothetical protein
MRFILITILFLAPTLLFSQEEKVKPIYQSFRKEPTKGFVFEKFDRGFNAKELNLIFDSLNTKQQNQWLFGDSLLFAVSLLKAEKKEASLKVFSGIGPGRITNSVDFKYLITAYQINGELKAANSLVKLYKQKFPNHINEIGAQERIIEFKLYLRNKEINKKWISANHILPLDFQNDSLDKDTVTYNRMQQVLEQYEKELRFQSNFTFEEDPILAAVAADIGLLLERYYSYSQAYVAYSIARNYDKSNKFVVEQLKVVRSYLNQKKYHLPIFRNFFPRKKKGRFELSTILNRLEEEKKEAMKEEPINEIRPREKDKYEKYLDQFDTNLIYAAILFLILLFILLFIRSRR